MTFPAKFRGKCADCGEWWPEGASIRHSDDGYSHADCDAQTAERPNRPACERCWLETTTEGKCPSGCDD